MNKYWPQDWKKSLPNFLGEDFFSTFENFEGMADEAEATNNTKRTQNQYPKVSGIKVDLYERGHELVCICRLPGLRLNEVEIDVYDMTLEITGEVSLVYEGFRPVYQEIYQGPVRRKVKLPYPVRHDQVDASYRHGYLYIHLHRLIRSVESKPKVIIDDLEG